MEVEERKQNVGFLLSGIQEPPTLGGILTQTPAHRES